LQEAEKKATATTKTIAAREAQIVDGDEGDPGNMLILAARKNGAQFSM
jgi:hypothetical protein